MGVTGSKGDIGTTGPVGLKGDTGAIGPIGSTGSVGTIGPQGVKGDTGLQGAKGDTGSQGLLGLQGNQGVKGDNGAVGPTGLQGNQGIQGFIGPVGATGLIGIAWKGQWVNTTTYVLRDVVNFNGTSYIGITSSNIGNTPPNAMYWELLAQKGDAGVMGATGPQGLQGVTGDTGVVGPTGAQGTKGATGTTGLQGLQGPQGIIGLTGAIGTTGAQGVKGDTGAIGPVGATGATGMTWKGLWDIATSYNSRDTINYNGTSYVSIASSNIGVVPTNTSFWAVLAQKGDLGPVGVQGIQGIKGDAGATGTQGVKGDIGAIGPVGLKGDTGAIGPIGSTGVMGTIGPQGVKGDPGVIGLQGTAGIQGQQGATGTFGMGVNSQSVNYTALPSDNGKLITMNGASLALTLPSAAPSTVWYVAVKNLNASALTISSTAQINGAANPITVGQYQVVQIWTNGSSYFSSPALIAGTGITLKPTSNGLVINSEQPTLFKPLNFNASVCWQYFLSTTATKTTVLTSGNFTVPDGVYFVTIEAIGGSGSGSYGAFGQYNSAGGGGSGEYSGTFLAVKPGTIINITYGAAGLPSYVGETADGGTTVVTYNSIIYVTAHGGKAGTSGAYTVSYGGAGGYGSTDLQHTAGINGSNGTLCGASTTRPGGFGGIGITPTNISSNSGGNGGSCGPGSSSTAGTAGTPGAVVISYM